MGMTDKDWEEAAAREDALVRAHDERLQRSERELALVERTILARRREWPLDELPAILARRAEDLQKSAPQTPIQYNETEWEYAPRTQEAWYPNRYSDWIDPATILHTVDPVWGKFSRRQGMVLKVVLSLLETATLREDLVLQFFDSWNDPIRVLRHNGPAGPIFELNGGGSHRVHMARMLELPLIYVDIEAPGRPLYYAPSLRSGFSPVDAEARWAGLIRLGLIEGVIERGERIELHRADAPWLVEQPEIVCNVNRAYERLYPGALTHFGIPAEAQTDPSSWRSLLVPSIWQRLRGRLLRPFWDL